MYNEYLPVILGPRRAREAKVSSEKGFSRYNNGSDRGMINEVAVAALR